MGKSRHRHSSSHRLTKVYLPIALAILAGGAAIGGGLYLLNRKSPEDHLRAGIAMQASGDLKGAAIELKNALQSRPDNAEARYRLGQIQFASGDYQSAEKEFRKSRELGVRDAKLDPLYARTLLSLRQAKRLLEEVQPVESSSVDTRAAVLALRARAHLMLGDTAACEKTLHEADAVLPDHPETLISRAYLAISDNKPDTLTPIDQPRPDAPKRAAEAIALVDQALLKAPDRVDILLLKADLLHATKQNELALKAYSRAIELEPTNANALRARAQLHIEASNLDKGENDLKLLFKQAPNDVYGRYLRGFIEFKRTRFAEANTTLQEVLRVAPTFLPAQLLAGAVNIGLGNREAARSHLDKVLGVAPQHPLAKKLMAATLADMSELGKAQELVDTLSESDNNSLTSNIKGEIALRRGDFPEAKKYLEQVSGSAAQNPVYLTHLAASRMGSGDKAGAVAALNKAAELDTGSARPEVLLVVTHLREKRYNEALQVVDKLEKERPKDPLVHNLRGSITLSQGDVSKARAHFAKALEIKPDYFPATSNLALIDVREKDMKSARARFQQLLKANPRESRAWMALAAMDMAERNEAGYYNDLEQAKKANDKDPQPRMQLIRYWIGKNDPAKALVEAKSALDATGQAAFNELIGLAQAAQGDHTSALATFGKWSAANPKNPLAHFRLAQEQVAAKDQNGALKSLDKALALQPDFTEASVFKAILLGQMGRTAEGIKIARDLQTRLPKIAMGFLAEADILVNNKQYSEAGRLFAKGAQLAGNSMPLVRASHMLSQAGQTSEAEKLLTEWLKTHPNDAPARHQIALSHLQAKHLKEAADHYRILARANPKDLVAYNNLAWLLGELGDKEALPVAEQAYRLSPDSATTMDTLGWILVNAGQAQRGVDLLKKALKKAPNSPDIHWHLAAGLAKAGDRQLARQELERLLGTGRAFPEEASARKLLDSLR